MEVKTVFYKPSTKEYTEPDYFEGDTPYDEWFELPILYDTDGKLVKEFIDENRIVKAVSIVLAIDEFSNEGITRRIFLHIQD